MLKKLVSVLLAAMIICALIPLSAAQISAASDGEPIELKLNTQINDAVTQNAQSKKYRFVPDKDGVYGFTVISDELCRCTFSAGSGTYAQNGGEVKTVKYELSKGAACTLEIVTNGSFSISVEPSAFPQKLEVLTPPGKTEYYSDTLQQDMDFSGMKLRITWSDGSKTEWKYGDDKTPLKGEEFYYSCDEANEVKVYVGGCTADLSVTVSDTPVKSVEIKGALPKLIKEGSGFWDACYEPDSDEYIEFFFFFLSELDGAAVVVSYKDGTTANGKINGFIGNYKISVSADDGGRNYAVGDKNKATLSFCGFKTAIYLTVTESPVKSIELDGDAEIKLIENYNGSTDYRYDTDTGMYDIEFFRYNYGLDSKVRVNYSDGTSKTADVFDKIDGYEISLSDTQEAEPWTVGGRQYATLRYLNAELDIPVTVTPNPVENIEIPDGTALTPYENTDGYYQTYTAPDNSEHRVFLYYIPDLSDIPVIIRYTDSTVPNAHIGDIISGCAVSYSDTQYEQAWTKGAENFIDVELLGRSAKLPVNIVDSPVKSIEITSYPTREYVLGDIFCGGTESFMPCDLSGLAFTVHFTDGSSKSYTSADIYGERLDGHFISLVPANDGQTLGQNPFTLEYMGKSAVFNVTVVQSPVKSVKLTKLPDVTAYSQYFLPDFSGAKITVTYKDGKTKEITLSRDNLTYNQAYYHKDFFYSACFDADGITAELRGLCQNDEASGDEKHIFTLSVGDVECEISGMEYKEHSRAESAELEDYSETGKNMLVKVKYEDGTAEDIRLTDTFVYGYNYYPDSVCRGAFTGKGILNYMTADSDDVGFSVGVFDIYILVDRGSIPGDINGDGTFNIDDATALQRYLAEFAGIDKARVEKCGDVNGDGKINIEDVTFMQRSLAEFKS